MKKFTIVIVSIIFLSVISFALLWLRARPTTARVELSGIIGSPFTGFYVRDGQHVAISGVLPWSFQSKGVSEFEFHKVHPKDSVTFTAYYEEPNEAAEEVMEVPSGDIGLRCKFQDHGIHAEGL